ncbi:DsrE family protein [Roseixanthobacter liquoris]|uniref:DsrE family protein n=1 Tax=Roseixanthobacter liquoris TaxID=3119921 RepID=UPI00372CD753
MAIFDRRAFLGSLALAGAAPVAASAAQSLQLKDIAKEADSACLYHCDFGEPPRFVQTLTNISNHYSTYGADPFAIQIALVAHGPGVKFFLESLDDTTWRDEVMVPQIFEKVEGVAKNGLKVYLCSITFERLKLDRNKVRKADFIAFVPSGVATVAALQNKGFAYIKIG